MSGKRERERERERERMREYEGEKYIGKWSHGRYAQLRSRDLENTFFFGRRKRETKSNFLGSCI